MFIKEYDGEQSMSKEWGQHKLEISPNTFLWFTKALDVLCFQQLLFSRLLSPKSPKPLYFCTLRYWPDNYKTFNVWFTAQLFQCLASFISRFCNLLPIWGIMPELHTHQLHWACTSQRGYFPRKAWLQMFISVWHYKETFHNGYISFLHNSALVYDWCIIDTIVAASNVLVPLC